MKFFVVVVLLNERRDTMEQINYLIELEAPIGIKHGKITAEIDGSEIAGILNVMNADNSFTGTIDENGCCKIVGSVRSLLYTLNYIATGMVTKEFISLALKTDKYILKITGGADSEEIL